MAQFFTDFSEYDAGNLFDADDWENIWDDGGDHTVVHNDDSYVEVEDTMGSESNGFIPAESEDTESVAKIEIKGDVFGAIDGGVGVRMTGSSSTSDREGYVFTADSTQINLTKYVNDEPETVAKDDSYSTEIDEQFWVRLRISADQLEATFWEDGQQEPSTPQLTATDSDVTGSGAVGFFNTSSGETHIHEMGFGTEGDTAPTEPVNGDEPNAPSDLTATLQ